MRANEKNLSTPANSDLDLSWGSLPGPVVHRAYHELADLPVVELDALAQLEMNLRTLEDLQGRLSFLMRDVAGLMKI